MQQQSLLDIEKYENWLGWKNKVARLSWNIAYFIFFRPFATTIFNPWRLFLLRLFGARLHIRAHVHASVRIWAPWNLTMGAYACLGPHVNCYNVGPIHIGDYTTISQGVYLCPGSHDLSDPKFPMIPSKIHIEDQVWIATDAFIGPKVHIGQGAVIGARAAVFRNVEPWAVVGGNPATFIKTRVIKQ
ncbi:putative colanic acid biosynthesis acetyltransferase [Alistipes sp.]|uniref:putative colanic acid biosynthesis acetyltransferase n=1 Tax=Alistipes sp. TaxID=1872444 RepID=UPI003AEF6E3F